MELKKIGSIEIEPRTTFHWDADTATTIEHTPLPDDLALIQASKTYRILKQDREGQENWDSNLRELNDYLATTFDFQITIDYVNETCPDVTGIQQDAIAEKQKLKELLAEKQQLETELPDLEAAADTGRGNDTFQEVVNGKRAAGKQQLENIDDKIDRATQRLHKLRQEAGQWRRNGVMLAYVFTVTTAPEITGRDWKSAAEDHVDRMQQHHRQHIMQTLAGPNSKFKLAIEEINEPRVFNRRQYSTLLNPDAFHGLIEANPDIEETLRQLRRTAVAQFQAFSLQDIELDDSVVERSKATPAQAVNGLLQSLDAEHVATMADTPTDGPLVGTLAGTNQVVGFNPADRFEHIYLAGKTGSGKSYLGRVLLENAASNGAHGLVITPTDKQALGAAFPHAEHDDGHGLAGDFYWPDHEQLLDWPTDVDELLAGLKFVSCHGVSSHRTGELLDEVFTRLYESEYDAGEPLFLFVDEAQTLPSTARDTLKQIVKEKRKHNIHVIIATQDPKAFKRAYSDLRRETTTIFLRGEYFNYSKDFTHILSSKQEVAKLDRRQAILHSMELPKLTVDVRTPISQVEEPSDQQITELDRRYTGEPVEPPKHSRTSNTKTEVERERGVAASDHPEIRMQTVELTEKQEELLAWIREFLDRHEEYEYVSAKNCHDPEDAPCTTRTAKNELESLVEKDVLEKEETKRNYASFMGYRPVNHED